MVFGLLQKKSFVFVIQQKPHLRKNVNKIVATAMDLNDCLFLPRGLDGKYCWNERGQN